MRFFKKQITFTGKDSKLSRSELVDIIQEYGKTANRRMRLLEEKNLQRQSFGYRNQEANMMLAVKGLKANRSGNPMFMISNKDLAGMTRNQLLSEAREIELFLSSKNTPAEVKKQYDKAYKTLLKNNEGLGISRETFDSIMTSQVWNTTKLLGLSAQVLDLINKHENELSESEILQILKDAEPKVAQLDLKTLNDMFEEKVEEKESDMEEKVITKTTKKAVAVAKKVPKVKLTAKAMKKKK